MGVLSRCFDERSEERVWAGGTAFQFRVKLRREKPRVIGELDDLHEATVGRQTAQRHAVLGEKLSVLVVHLEAMTMTLGDFRSVINRTSASS